MWPRFTHLNPYICLLNNGAQFESENLTLHNVIQLLRPKMGRMCCVFGCKSIYRSQKNVSEKPGFISVYEFPVNAAEKQSWISNM